MNIINASHEVEKNVALFPQAPFLGPFFFMAVHQFSLTRKFYYFIANVYFFLCRKIFNRQISKLDRLPHGVCQECIRKLTIMYEMTDTCKRAYDELLVLKDQWEQSHEVTTCSG
jgi:hypothetical protein